MINFNTENLLIVLYPKWAGGKFLINCLGLSDDAILQSASLAQNQYEGNLSKYDKFLFINSKILKTQQWQDLNLGCHQLFGVYNYDYFNPDIKHHNFNSIISKISNDIKKFFIVAHDHNYVNAYLKIWNNAKIITFINSEKFIKHRTSHEQEEVINYDLIPKTKILHYVDNNVYFDEDDTVNEIKMLYNKLGLKDFDEELIRRYYNLWIKKAKNVTH